MHILKSLIKSTGVYLSGIIGSKLISFFMLPLYTAFISTADYGSYDLYCTYATLFAGVLFFEVWCGIMRFVLESKEEADKYKIIYSGILLFAGSVCFYIVLFTIIGKLFDVKYLIWVCLYGLALSVQNLYGYIARSLGLNIHYAISGICSTLVNAFANILLIAVLGWDYRSLFIAYIAGIFVQVIVLEYELRLIRKFRVCYLDKTIALEVFKFSIPLSISTLGYWFLTGINKVVIANVLGMEANGLFSIASKFGMLISFVASCFSFAWQELAFTRTDRSKETTVFYSNATNTYIKVLICGYCLIVPAVFIVFPFFIKGAYHAAKNIIPIYMMATLCDVFHGFLASIINAYKKTYVIFISTCIACVTNIIVLYLGIGSWGLYSGAVAIFFGFLVGSIMRLIILRRYIGIKVDLRMPLYLSPIVAVCLLGYVFGNFMSNAIVIVIVSGVIALLFRDVIKEITRKSFFEGSKRNV